MSKYLFHSGNVWNGKSLEKEDLLIEDGVIKKTGIIRDKSNDMKEIDLEGAYVLPGFFDMHTHLPSGDDVKVILDLAMETASRGGFTGICIMPDMNPVNDNPFVTQYLVDQSKGKSCELKTIGAITKNLEGKTLSEIGLMKEAGIVAISDSTQSVMNSYIMRKALDYAKGFDLLVINHPEDKNLSKSGLINEGEMSAKLGLAGKPTASEAIMVSRDLFLAEWTRSRLHIPHLSCQESLELFALGKEKGILVTASVSPNHLLFTEEDLIHYDANFKINPPLRTKTDQEYIIDALDSGVVDCFASGHLPCSSQDKNVDFVNSAYGAAGLETAVSATYQLVHQKQIRLDTWVNAWTKAPRRTLNLKIPKIEVGEKANLTIFDPKQKILVEENNFVSKATNSPFIGRTLQGQVLGTFYQGKFYEARAWKTVDK